MCSLRFCPTELDDVRAIEQRIHLFFRFLSGILLIWKILPDDDRVLYILQFILRKNTGGQILK